MSSAATQGGFTVLCSAQAVHAGHHRHIHAVQNGDQHSLLPHTGHAAAWAPCFCGGWRRIVLFVTIEWHQAPLHNPTARGKGFCSCFLQYCWRGAEKANSASTAGEHGEWQGAVDTGREVHIHISFVTLCTFLLLHTGQSVFKFSAVL